MNIKHDIYYLVKGFLCQKKANKAVKFLVMPISKSIPDRLISLVPIVGRIPIKLSDGCQFLLETSGDDPLANFLFFRGFDGFEAETTPFFIELAKRSDFIFDVGANIGYYSLLAAAVNPKSHIYAFEPVNRVYERLTQNVELNHFSNIVCIFGAVTNLNGVISLYTPNGNQITCSASTLVTNEKDVSKIEVPAITLDSFAMAKENKIPRVDLIKIDTERTEHIVLDGASRIIERDKPTIICEVLPGSIERCLQSHFDKMGTYIYYHITNDGLIMKKSIEGDPNLIDRNYLFINNLQEHGWLDKWIKK